MIKVNHVENMKNIDLKIKSSNIGRNVSR